MLTKSSRVYFAIFVDPASGNLDIAVTMAVHGNRISALVHAESVQGKT